jgi:hypothetical protein
MTREKAYKELTDKGAINHQNITIVLHQHDLQDCIDTIFDYFENKKDEPQEHKNQAVINFCDENEEILKDLG